MHIFFLNKLKIQKSVEQFFFYSILDKIHIFAALMQELIRS